MYSETAEYAQHKLFKNFVIVLTVIYFVFMFVNFFDNQFVLFAIQALIFISNLIIILKFQQIVKAGYIDNLILAYSVTTLAILLFVFSHGITTNLNCMWMFIIPFLSYMNGIRLGSIITLVFICLSIAIYLFIDQAKQSFNSIQFLNFILSIMSGWVLTHTYENIKHKMTDILVETSKIDPLTKLKNRSQLYDIYRQYRTGVVALILVDIDQLNLMNEEHGYLAGDAILINIAKIIANHVGDDAYAFRVDGDEFAIFVPNAEEEHCLRMAKQIFADIVDYHPSFKNEFVSVQVSIALNAIKTDGRNLDELIKKTNPLLKQAKQSATDKIAIGGPCC